MAIDPPAIDPPAIDPPAIDPLAIDPLESAQCPSTPSSGRPVRVLSP
ncbi:hypothetical protein [Mycobacterium sp. Lab-001]